MSKEQKTYHILLWSQKIWESRVSNIGDLAMLMNLIRRIKKEIPNAELYMFSDDPQYAHKRYGINSYPIKYIFNPLTLYKILKKIDLIILGGGTVIQDNNFIGIIPMNLSIPLIARFCGKKVMCIAIGIGSEEEVSSIGKILTTFALNRFQMISVRDPESLDLLSHWLDGKVPVILTHDLALNIPEVDFEVLYRVLKNDGIDLFEKPTVVIAPRRIFHHEKTFFYFIPSSIRVKIGLMHPLFKKRLSEFQNCLAEFCDYIIQKYNVNVLFIPFYPSGGNVDTSGLKTPRRLFTTGDTEFAREVFQKIQHKKNAMILERNLSPEEIKTIIGKCKVMIGVPYHSIVFASSSNVPVIAISYTSKVQRYMRILGMEEYSIPANITEGVSLELLKLKFDHLWANREQIIKHFKEMNQKFLELSDLNIQILKSVLKGDYKIHLNTDENILNSQNPRHSH